MKPSRRAHFTGFVMALVISACPLVAAHPVDPVDVVIRDYKFEPSTIEVRVGQTVKWTNGEKRTSHSVLFKGSSGFETDRLFPGESWERLFDTPGTYLYTCGPHAEMSGKVVVFE